MLYSKDIESTIPEECLHFQKYVQTMENIEGLQSINFFKFLVERKLDFVFPNVSIALRLFLSLAVTNCSAERSFSYLKRIKHYLRSTILQKN